MELPADKGTRELFAARKVELTRPDFNAQIMQAIAQERFAQTQRQLLLTWLLVVGSAEVVMGLCLWAFRVTLSDIANAPYAFINQVGEATHWVLDQHYLFIPLAVVLLFKGLLDSRIRYS